MLYTIRSRLPRGAIFYHEPATFTIEGELLDNPEWVAHDCITIRVADGIRVVPRRDIVGNTVPPPSRGFSHEVIGSRGDRYTVARTSTDLWSCTCSGYHYRRDCRHVRHVKNLFERVMQRRQAAT
jgi:hypothetical protein